MEVQPRNEYCNEAVTGQECHNAQYLRRYLHNIYTDIYTNIYTDKRSDRVGGGQLLPCTFLTPIHPGKYSWKLLDTQTH